MFLNRLDFIEKEAFVSLAVRAAEANGHFALPEETAAVYCIGNTGLRLHAEMP